MKIPPKKPQFFKPIQPGFKHGLKIPIGFLKYLKGHDHIEHAILRRAGKKWLVKVNGWRLEDGWKKFAEEHDLQLGDLLIFKHEGNMEFEVIIFDSSHCDREYAEYLQEGGNNVEETSKKVKFKEAVIHNPCGQSHFECTVRPYCISNGYLRIPKQFAMANGLINKKCGLIIRDERKRSWNLRLATYDSIVHILGGWGDFRVANDLKEGDYMMFEAVANGEKPIWKFHGAATHKPFGQSHFVCTVRHYCLFNDLLCIPRQFALANGLTNKKCDLIIRDEWQRSWNVKLRSFGASICIRDGWHEFRDANCLKEGDCIMFEVVSNGNKPIWKFNGKYTGKDAKHHRGH